MKYKTSNNHPSIMEYLPPSFLVRTFLLIIMGIPLSTKVVQSQDDISPELKLLTAKGSKASLIFFKPELNLDARNIFTIHKQAFSLGTMDEMNLVEQSTCSLGDVHYEFQQTHKGIPIIGANYVIHEHDGKAESGNGSTVNGLNISIIPQVSEAAALQSALISFGAQTYHWEVPSMESWVKSMKNDTLATFYPTGKLAIINPSMDGNPTKYKLAWEFLISSHTPFDSRLYYVDAISGQVLQFYPRITSTSAVGSASTVYSGTRSISTDYIGLIFRTYRLIDNSRGSGIQTWNIQKDTTPANAINFTDSDNYWDNVNTTKDEYATDAHWGMAVTYDYYNGVHTHNSYDGAGAKKVNSYVHWGGSLANNAFWWGGGELFGFGDGNGVTRKPKVSLDIVAHEYTHAVTQNVVSPPHGLEYQGESGALNEAYSDIFGILVEYWVKGNNPGLWLFAEDVVMGGETCQRNIPDPKSKNQPSTYRKAPWYFGAADHGGVHRNNSVGTLWFYYLVNGGSGKNDKGHEFNVKGIGMAKAEKIAFRTLSYYHTRFDQYSNARDLSYKAAMDLYCTIKPVDSCCNEARQVLNAWYAVGVGDPLLMFEKIDIKKPECDSANGEATAFVKGVKGTPKYAWSNGDTTAKADSLAPGSYTLTVTDTSTGCEIDTLIEIKENANFWFDAMAANVTECGKDDGWARVFCVVEGTPDVIWSNGGTTKKIENLAPGKYSVTVTDTSTNCSRDTMVEVKEWGPEVQVVGGGNRTICKGRPMPTFTLSAITKSCPSCEYNWSNGGKGPSITVSSPGAYSVTVKSGKCTATAGTSVVVWIKDCDSADEWEVPIIASSDPNDIAGPIGYGEPHFVSPSQQMNYLVRFENDPVFATAAARKVIVTVPLHPNTTLFTFKLGDFGFGDFIFSVPENTTFYTNRLDVSDSLGVAVDITAGINVATHEAFWIFNAVDPITGLEPADATLGFLPVNDSITHRGEGFVNFSIQPATGLVTGDSVSKQAVIVFDINEEIPTNIWTNLVDAVAPSSRVDSLPNHSDSTIIRIRFSGNDDIGGSGIATYSLYYSKDDGPFTFFKEFSTDTNAYFSGEAESVYRFFSIAKDNVGNEEAMKQLPEATTTLHETPVNFWVLSGNARYTNAQGTSLADVSIQVLDTAGDLSATDVTNANGLFEFPELREGTYDLISSYVGPWGGGNAIDALLILKHFAELITLNGVQKAAADVNASGFINASDAQQVASRFVNVIDSFAAGDWCFYPDQIFLNQDSFLNLQALCYGDINGSFVPGTKAIATIGISTDQVMYLGKDIEYTIPIRLSKGVRLNAASIVLHYPAKQIEILGLEMPDVSSSEIFWSNQGGSLRIAWFNLESKDIETSDIFLNLHLRLKPGAKTGNISFDLDALSQLGDQHAEVISDVSLLMPKLIIKETLLSPALSSYPNPFSQEAEILINLPEAAHVNFQVFDAGGTLVKILYEGLMQEGQQKLIFKSDHLPSGVYFCQMEVRTQATRQTISHKMILTRPEGQ